MKQTETKDLHRTKYDKKKSTNKPESIEIMDSSPTKHKQDRQKLITPLIHKHDKKNYTVDLSRPK